MTTQPDRRKGERRKSNTPIAEEVSHYWRLMPGWKQHYDCRCGVTDTEPLAACSLKDRRTTPDRRKVDWKAKYEAQIELQEFVGKKIDEEIDKRCDAEARYDALLSVARELDKMLSHAKVVIKRAEADRHWDDQHYWNETGFGGSTLRWIDQARAKFAAFSKEQK